MTDFHIAQMNIARAKAPLNDPLMAGFATRLEEINALAEQSAGFVWRPTAPEGDAYIQPYDDERILVNMSVWETIEHLRQYVYRSTHAEFLRPRHTWFEKLTGAYLALWWIPAGHQPSMDEAKQRLAYLEAHGPSPFAFTFSKHFSAEQAAV